MDRYSYPPAPPSGSIMTIEQTLRSLVRGKNMRAWGVGVGVGEVGKVGRLGDWRNWEIGLWDVLIGLGDLWCGMEEWGGGKDRVSALQEDS